MLIYGSFSILAWLIIHFLLLVLIDIIILGGILVITHPQDLNLNFCRILNSADMVLNMFELSALSENLVP
jgi:hypothetical protein